ncbi:beta-ketoacyl-ACP synthase III [Wolbachia endosymbiont of Pentidionis agamae]|uniref:beta-ketoacyl-ACP synthase III n=1 Tax=Wolbachia endosymbiont of Pentidionis agamae TaxID=3110435 RepID=UPI002FD123EC
MNKSYILSTGSYLPRRVLSNEDIALKVDTNDEWIRKRSGIVTRHIANENEVTSDLAVKAAINAIEKTNISNIDFIVVATTTPDKTFPSCATIVQHKLGYVNCFAFDVQAACAGFLYALTVADALLKSSSSSKDQNALVIGADIMSRVLDWKDRSTCVLFGDGGGAVILGSKQNGSEDGCILSTHLHSDGNIDVLYTNGGVSTTGYSGTVCMRGQELFKLAVEKLVSIVEETLMLNKIKITDIGYLIPHQANIRIIQAVAARLGFPIEKIAITIEKHANTSAASIPLALDYAARESKIKAGDLVLLIAIGAGLTWGSVLFRYSENKH